MPRGVLVTVPPPVPDFFTETVTGLLRRKVSEPALTVPSTRNPAMPVAPVMQVSPFT